MPKNTLHNKCKLLVSHFCAHAKFVNWGKEIKIAKKLLADNSEVKYWLSLQLSKPIFSLSWFLTKEGKDFLQVSKLKQNLVLPKASERAILKDKIGEDKQVSQKPKTIFEFLNHGKKEDR
jgi:hypothetical protein